VNRRVNLYIKSAACSAWFRVHGIRSSVVTCEGRLPVLHGGGSVVIQGRLAVRGRVARCELGAGPNGRLEIGERVFINQGASLVASHRIEIGDDVRIGDFSAVYDSDYHSVDPYHPMKCAPVIIGVNVWLGRGVVVLPGSSIGDHTVVAAGSVVRGDVPPRVLVAGNPGQIVREIRVGEGWRRG
jgi:acetyltransferase-like isoleucine patch superfamily enzyme